MEHRLLVRARVGASILSLMSGLMLGAWASRAPDVKSSTGADDAIWGFAYSVSRVGSLVGMVAVLVVIGRMKTRPLALAGAGLVLILAPALAGSSSVAALIVYLTAWSFANTLLSTPMTALTLEVQRRYGRPLLSTFGAFWSCGSFLGAGLGVVAAAIGLSPALQLGLCSVVLGAALLGTCRWLPTDDRSPADSPRAVRRRFRDRFTTQLGLLAWMRFLTIFMATAGSSWAAIHTAQTLHAGAVWGAATYTGFTVANTVALLLVGRALARTDQLRFFRISTAIGGLAIAAALGIATPIAAVLGFVVLGVGTACIDPVVFGLGGSQPGITPGEGISVVEIGDLPGALISSALIGTIATASSLRIALLAITAALLALAGSTYWITPRRPQAAVAPT